LINANHFGFAPLFIIISLYLLFDIIIYLSIPFLIISELLDMSIPYAVFYSLKKLGFIRNFNFDYAYICSATFLLMQIIISLSFFIKPFIVIIQLIGITIFSKSSIIVNTEWLFKFKSLFTEFLMEEKENEIGNSIMEMFNYLNIEINKVLASHCTTFLLFLIAYQSYSSLKSNFELICSFLGIIIPNSPVLSIKDLTENSVELYWFEPENQKKSVFVLRLRSMFKTIYYFITYSFHWHRKSDLSKSDSDVDNTLSDLNNISKYCGESTYRFTLNNKNNNNNNNNNNININNDTNTNLNSNKDTINNSNNSNNINKNKDTINNNNNNYNSNNINSYGNNSNNKLNFLESTSTISIATTLCETDSVLNDNLQDINSNSHQSMTSIENNKENENENENECENVNNKNNNKNLNNKNRKNFFRYFFKKGNMNNDFNSQKNKISVDEKEDNINRKIKQLESNINPMDNVSGLKLFLYKYGSHKRNKISYQVEVNGYILNEEKLYDQHIIINGLKPSTFYKIRIWSIMNNRIKSSSSFINVQTLKSYTESLSKGKEKKKFHFI